MSDEIKINARSRLVRALLLSALLLFGALAQTVHESTVVHAICPEHGEILDVGPRVDASVAVAAHEHATGAHATARGEDGPRAQSSGAQAGHDECLFATLLKADSVTWIGAPSHPVPLAREARDEAVDAARVAAIPTLSFAPKHSPPSRSV
jgi:hypothetical protein